MRYLTKPFRRAGNTGPDNPSRPTECHSRRCKNPWAGNTGTKRKWINSIPAATLTDYRCVSRNRPVVKTWICDRRHVSASGIKPAIKIHDEYTRVINPVTG